MLFESLENRALLSASLVNGVLTITGTDNRDHIVVFQHSKTTIGVSESTAVPSVTAGKPPTITHHLSTFNIADVKSIVVNAGKDNDSVNTGGSLFHPLKIVSTIDGGDGNDYLAGGNAGDVINGGAGRDFLVGRGGNDLLNGGSGNDHLIGGKGSDTMNGDAGNDYINAFDRATTDHVDGGSNDPVSATNAGDRALVDDGDIVAGIEKLKKVAIV
jgi:Ca2+-binding RTX toxin-like protein